MKKELSILSSICVFLLIAAVYGIYLESRLHNAFDGSYVHILVAPAISLLCGLAAILFWGRQKSFVKKIFIGWGVFTAIYLLLLLLAMRHYGFQWQPEWYLFWGVLSVLILFITWSTSRRNSK